MSNVFRAARRARLSVHLPSRLSSQLGLSPLALAATAALFTPLLVSAQATAAQSSASLATTVVVTGNPLGRDPLTQPATALSGDALDQRRAATLGETLDGLPGVAGSGFGPQASRPVIRGLDGDRIRLLDNGGASADASNLSFDHAVALDPLVVERIEVLRGPAALLYGGNATGGVVNALDNRIPRQAVDRLGGRAELRLGGASAERSSAMLLEGPAGGSGLSWHVDAADHRSDDLRTPRFAPLRDGQPDAPTARVINSAGHSQSGALGASWADADGYAGLAVDHLSNDYGTTVEPDVSIRLRRQHLQAAGERRLHGELPFDQLQWQFSSTRYQHQEVEGDGAVGTTFRSQGREWRLQARQRAPGLLQGVVGLQLETLTFEALGTEAFVPSTHTRSSALFTQQALALPGGATLNAGARLERVDVASDGDAADAEAARFGAAQSRRFTPRSAMLGLVLPLGRQAPGAAGHHSGWQLSATVGHTERAPAYYELFANGVHVATGAYERGDATLGTERSRHAELGLAWRGSAGTTLQWQWWHTRFAQYIALDASGTSMPVDGGAVPEYRFTGLPAALHGAELTLQQRLSAAGGWQLDGQLALDTVRGSRSDTGAPLPRIAPQRLTLGLQALQGDWQLGGQLRRLARQDEVGLGDSATPGATLLDLSAGWRQRLAGGQQLQWSLKLANATNALAYSASTVPTARWLAPAGGRALGGSVRLLF